MANAKTKNAFNKARKRGKGPLCNWCGIDLVKPTPIKPDSATFDHVHPRSVTMGWNTKVWCCRACNTVKADMSLKQWETFMNEFPDWRTFYREKWLYQLRAKFVEICRAINL